LFGARDRAIPVRSRKAGIHVAKKAEKAPTEEVALDGEAPKKSKKKMILIIIIILLVAALGAGGFFGYKWWMGKKVPGGSDNATEQETKTEHGGEAKSSGHGDNATAVAGAGEIVSIPPLLVNLADPQGRRYLKIALDVELKDKAAADELNKNMPKVKDALLLLLSSKTYEVLSTLEDKIMLKKEIVERLSLVLGEQKVLRVYITEIVIQ
jgi:flagellar FliL protein